MFVLSECNSGSRASPIMSLTVKERPEFMGLVRWVIRWPVVIEMMSIAGFSGRAGESNGLTRQLWRRQSVSWEVVTQPPDKRALGNGLDDRGNEKETGWDEIPRGCWWGERTVDAPPSPRRSGQLGQNFYCTTTILMSQSDCGGCWNGAKHSRNSLIRDGFDLQKYELEGGLPFILLLPLTRLRTVVKTKNKRDLIQVAENKRQYLLSPRNFVILRFEMNNFICAIVMSG